MVDNMMGLALLAGPANIVMQLARPGVGYGVVDSKVESGRADLHPVKRGAHHVHLPGGGHHGQP